MRHKRLSRQAGLGQGEVQSDGCVRLGGGRWHTANIQGERWTLCNSHLYGWKGTKNRVEQNVFLLNVETFLRTIFAPFDSFCF